MSDVGADLHGHGSPTANEGFAGAGYDRPVRTAQNEHPIRRAIGGILCLPCTGLAIWSAGFALSWWGPEGPRGPLAWLTPVSMTLTAASMGGVWYSLRPKPQG
jgi:hypothetical protein